MHAAVIALEVFSHQDDVAGESPLWSAREQALFWVDIGRKNVFRKPLGGGASCRWPVPHHPGCVAELTAGRLVVAMGDGLHALDSQTGALGPLRVVPETTSGMRFNDGKVDPRGRLWVGTMHNNFVGSGAVRRRDGVLYRFDASGAATIAERGLGVPNTLAWSPDESLFYFADSLDGRIYVYDYDGDSGAIANKSVFFEAANLGLPDGSAIDVEGCLWNARWDAGVIVRITPQGRIDRTIDVPVPRPTSCAFGSPNLDVLFVTSARNGLDEARLAAAPLSGSVFAVTGAAQGMPARSFEWQAGGH